MKTEYNFFFLVSVVSLVNNTKYCNKFCRSYIRHNVKILRRNKRDIKRDRNEKRRKGDR